MKVLIGIISINRAKILPKAIQSGLNQKLESKKIAVFDDGSTDNTRDLEAVFPQVEWYFEEHKGYIYARNKLMSETSAEYYCSLDDDSWFLKDDELSIAINYLDAHPDVACIAYDILSPDIPNQNPRTEPIETNLFVGCGHVLRLSAVKEAGYYTKFPGFYGGEERDLCIRLFDKGYKIVKMPGVHVWHDKSNVSRNPPKICTSLVCNDLSYAYMRFPFSVLLIGFPHKVILHLKLAFRNKQVVPTIKGFLDFFYILFTFQLKRKAVSVTAFKKYRSFF